MIEPLRHLRLERPLAVLDTEATGTDPANDRIVEFAALRLFPDGAVHRIHHLLDPGVPIPEAASDVHGIYDFDVHGRPRFAELAPRLAEKLDGCDLAGFNLRRFDLPLLAAEFARAGVAFPLAGRAVVDVMAIYHDREPRDLAAAVRFYCGRDHAGAHGALADALAAAAVLDAQVGRYAELPATPVGLHERLIEVDVAGQFRREGGRVVLAFGKHRGRPLGEVAAADPGYLRWLLGRPLLEDARALIERALQGPGDRD